MTSERTVLLVILSILVIVIVALTCYGVLILHGRTGAELITLAGAGLGSLGSILVSTASRSADTTQKTTTVSSPVADTTVETTNA